MKRLSLNLDDRTAERLVAQQRQESRTATEIIRRALDAYFITHKAFATTPLTGPTRSGVYVHGPLGEALRAGHEPQDHLAANFIPPSAKQRAETRALLEQARTDVAP